MIGWNEFYYYFIIGQTLLLSIIGLWFTAIMPGIGHWNRRFFRCFFIALILNDCSVLADIILSAYSVPNLVTRVLQVSDCLTLGLLLPMLTVLLLRCCGEGARESRLFQAVAGLWIVFFLLVTSGLYTDAFFFVAPDGLVYRGSWYPLMLLPVNAIMLLNLAGTIRRRRVLPRKVYLSFLVTLLPVTLTVLVQMFVDIFLFIGICTVLFALAMYSIILSDQIEQDARHQREIARQQMEIANQRASIMVLQMRPHFIYNTLTSIYSLCRRHPEKAPQVVKDFTTYLRKNFNAVASDAPIPFTSELEHTRAYLAVEQAQYANSLFVEYDTPHTFFRVPPLTLQPIVENAIKHGRDPYAGVFRISIRTRKIVSGNEITVSDNGRGFGLSDESKPHIALKNIQQRLELMCGGSLTITSNDGGGTVVTVTIP